MNQFFIPTKPDARVLILQIVCASLLSFSFRSWLAMVLLFVITNIVVAVMQGWRRGIQSGITYIIFFMATWGVQLLSLPVISDILPMFLMLMIRVYPVYLLCSVLIHRAPMNELLTALAHWHIPQVLLIPVAVIYRYIPTITKEITYVNESLKMRGLNSSAWGVLRHPIRSAERFLVPLLYRSEKIAEELSAASLCKGLTVDRKRSNCTDVKLGWQDFCYTAGIAVVVCILLYVNNTCVSTF